jgi:hypothetical protein
VHIKQCPPFVADEQVVKWQSLSLHGIGVIIRVCDFCMVFARG